MGASFVPIVVFTVLWGIVGIVCPIFAPKGPNRGIIQVVLMLTAATCWLFWLCAYMAQMNPLIGPRLDNETLIWIAHTWINICNDAYDVRHCQVSSHSGKIMLVSVTIPALAAKTGVNCSLPPDNWVISPHCPKPTANLYHKAKEVTRKQKSHRSPRMK